MGDSWSCSLLLPSFYTSSSSMIIFIFITSTCGFSVLMGKASILKEKRWTSGFEKKDLPSPLLPQDPLSSPALDASLDPRNQPQAGAGRPPPSEAVPDLDSLWERVSAARTGWAPTARLSKNFPTSRGGRRWPRGTPEPTSSTSRFLVISKIGLSLPRAGWWLEPDRFGVIRQIAGRGEVGWMRAGSPPFSPLLGPWPSRGSSPASAFPPGKLELNPWIPGVRCTVLPWALGCSLANIHPLCVQPPPRRTKKL